MDMACHASGGLLATAGADGKVLVWDVDGGFCTHFFKGHNGVVTSVIFHPDPTRLLVSFYDSKSYNMDKRSFLIVQAVIFNCFRLVIFWK